MILPMPPSPTDSHQRRPAWALQDQELLVSASPGELPVPALRRAHSPQVVALPAAMTLACAFYALALGGSMLLGIQARVLDGVPLSLGPAAFLYCSSRIAIPRATRVAQLVEATFVIIVLSLSLACLSYLGAMTHLPLRDREMIWIDRQIGFDWLAIMTALDHWPGVLALLDGTYISFTSQLIATVLVLIIARRTSDLDRFFVTFVCASAIAEIASVLLPTLGPMSVLASNANFTNVPTLGRTTADIVLALREGRLESIDLGAIDGIISFPSLHAAVAVIVPFTLRWSKPLFWPIALFDGMMLVSAVPSGNHYLADIIGGVTVAGLAIFSARPIHAMLDRRFRAATSTQTRYASRPC